MSTPSQIRMHLINQFVPRPYKPNYFNLISEAYAIVMHFECCSQQTPAKRWRGHFSRQLGLTRIFDVMQRIFKPLAAIGAYKSNQKNI